MILRQIGTDRTPTSPFICAEIDHTLCDPRVASEIEAADNAPVEYLAHADCRRSFRDVEIGRRAETQELRVGEGRRILVEARAFQIVFVADIARLLPHKDGFVGAELR